MNDKISLYKKTISNFATGVAIVTILDAQNKLCGMTINSLSSLSLKPNLISYNIDKSTHNLDIYLNNSFCINLLSDDQADISNLFAYKNDFQDFHNYKILESKRAILNNIIAALECKIYKIYEGGDHFIVVGEVIQSHLLSENKKPLLYFRSGYCQFT